MNVIIADRNELTVTSSVEIEIQKEQALSKAALINKVESPEQDQEVTRIAGELKAVQKAIEDSRVSAKEPFLDIGRRIDAKAKDLRKDLDEELLRINRILGDYAQFKLAQQRAAENARRLEIERIERERMEQERLVREAAEAERRRIEAEQREIARKIQAEKDAAELERRKLEAAQREAAQAAARAKNAEQAEAARKAQQEIQRQQAEARARAEAEAVEAQKLQAEIDRQKAISEAKALEEINTINQRSNDENAALCAAAPLDKTKGQSVREDWEFEVFDTHLAYRAHPAAFKLTPLATEIKAILDATGGRMAGVRAKKAAKVSVRASKTQPVLEV